MPAAVDAFFESYTAEYARGDASAISAHFTFPLHVTSDTGDGGKTNSEIVVIHVASQDEWMLQIDRLLAAYAKVGVGSARIAESTIAELSPRLFQAVVRWELQDARGDVLYGFDAAYTLAEIDGALRIAALVHNERPQLLALLARQRHSE